MNTKGFVNKIFAGVGLLALCTTTVLAQGNPILVHPLVSPKLTSSFGLRKHPIRKAVRHHSGVDLAAPLHTPIRSIGDGTIVYADPHGSYGNLIVVEHLNSYSSHYGHCQTMYVRPGEKVRAGQVIGTIGQTGGATGPHLHFELRKSGKPLDPLKIVDSLNAQAEG